MLKKLYNFVMRNIVLVTIIIVALVFISYATQSDSCDACTREGFDFKLPKGSVSDKQLEEDVPVEATELSKQQVESIERKLKSLKKDAYKMKHVAAKYKSKINNGYIGSILNEYLNIIGILKPTIRDWVSIQISDSNDYAHAMKKVNDTNSDVRKSMESYKLMRELEDIIGNSLTSGGHI